MINPGKLLRHLDRAPELLRARRHTAAGLSLIARYLELGSASYPFQLPLSSGGSIKLSTPVEVKVFWHVFVRDCYRTPERCQTIVDAGGNIGLFSIWAARRHPNARIVSLEPCEGTFRELEENLSSTGLGGSVERYQLGLAAVAGKRQMHGAGPSPHRGVVLRPSEQSSADVISIQCITLTELLDRCGLDTVDFLKMDIEGSEWEVLFSTAPEVLRRFRRMEIEYHEVHASFGYRPEQLIAHVESAGHKLIYREEDANRTGLAVFDLQTQPDLQTQL